MTSFDTLPLSPAQLQNLKTLGYTQMRPIQAQSLPAILEGKDVRGQAETGSGKTLAFGLGIMQKINPAFFGAQGIVLCPTRELADQVAQQLRKLARALNNIKVLTLCGGSALRPQIESLKHGAHIIVGTPGRVLDLVRGQHLNLSHIKVFVLDEADRMMDMGFFDDIGEISQATPLRKQTLFFSATFPEHILKISEGFQRNPVTVETSPEAVNHNLDHLFFQTTAETRFQDCAVLLKHFRPTSTLAFCNTKIQCEELADYLNDQGIISLVLHGDMDQRDREDVLVQFINRSCSVLVATDVAARGLDIDTLDAIINVELTPNVATHIHRIGRTGRKEAKGLALNLVTEKEMYRAERIEKNIDLPLTWQTIPKGNKQKPLIPPMKTICLRGGKKDKLRAGDILGTLTKDLGLPSSAVGKINIFDFVSFVAIERPLAEETITRLRKTKIKGKEWLMRFMDT
ncbi:ATP-dependent RNA helicase DbpA [Pelistega sp. NLN82]|uniref:ATP-dependent RNA helicase DbpA n=1 Tax=Pelistega ratti TaxID=2652177 RepID=A0A6L9Y818_9BURK|nr:ATP-dependent RNA helicase DbpA [Pelistega ratti]NEN76433.1 ATP-dependent RNA helicase DbpA [Pelistega ratti]